MLKENTSSTGFDMYRPTLRGQGKAYLSNVKVALTFAHFSH